MEDLTTGDRRFDPDRYHALTEGTIWHRRRGPNEAAVKIVRCVHGRMGTRYLVQDLASGRQWLINPSTLLGSYEPT